MIENESRSKTLAQLMRGEIWPEYKVEHEDVRDVLDALADIRNCSSAADVVVPSNHGIVLPW